jgi:uncharacterized surface protein with fasciclin (FAS1) repeats
MIEWEDRTAFDYDYFWAFDRLSETNVTISKSELASKIRNQVGLTIPNGSAKKEFIRTLGGNYIIWNNEDNTVSGSRPTVFGYNGEKIITCTPLPLEETTDNGQAWRVNSWFNFANSTLHAKLQNYPLFFDLLDQAGLYNQANRSFPFLEDYDYYTIFIPTAQALTDFRADTLSEAELQDLLKSHFVRDALIFTDNKMPANQYYTLGQDPGLTPYYSYPSTLQIRPGPDLIEILDSEENPYVIIEETEGITNVLATTNHEVTAVIHLIDKVLVMQE